MTQSLGRELRIQDGRDWHFVNGNWQDREGRALRVPDELLGADGHGLQAYHFAFHRGLCFQDLHVRFEFRLTPHSDAGIILRATDESHFYLLHFPDCGQASRAQHFWAAFSKMDDSGYLKIIKMEMVRRVPSNTRRWLSGELVLAGGRLSVCVGEHGRFDSGDDAYPHAGLVGLCTFGEAEIRNVLIQGEPATASPWNDRIRQPRNWFRPCPDAQYGEWQKPRDLVRLPDGEVLLNYEVQERPHEGNMDLTEAAGVQIGDGRILALIRPIYSPWMWETWSSDGGATWGPCMRGPFPGYATSNMLRTASGKLLLAHRMPCLTVHSSRDDGHTWDQGALIDSGLWALGSMLEVEPDVVLYVYWDTAMSLMRAQFIRVAPGGLEPLRTGAPFAP